MPRRLGWLALIVLTATLGGAELAFKVVVHPDNPIPEVTTEELSNFFLRKSSHWSDGTAVDPVDQAADGSLRERFSQQVHGRSTSSVVSYLNKLIFSGLAKPPLVVAGDREVLEHVRANRGAVGYVSPGAELGGVRALPLITPPIRTSHVQPQYTEGARRARLSGEVVLEVVVQADGTVGEVTAIKELGLGLTREAIAAVKKWQYLPATRDGTAIDATITVTVRF